MTSEHPKSTRTRNLIIAAAVSLSAGETASAVNVYRRVDNDTIAWRSFERTLDGEPLEDVPPVTIKRKPPPPAAEAADRGGETDNAHGDLCR